MKAAEIIRKLADMIDTHSDGEESRPSNSVPHAELEPVAVDNTDGTDPKAMVPPLQAKLELLKKATGVESHYDEQGCDCGSDPCECEPDELEVIKRHAGVPVAAVQEMSDDEPLDV
jgi:hypothetical protein